MMRTGVATILLAFIGVVLTTAGQPTEAQGAPPASECPTNYQKMRGAATPLTCQCPPAKMTTGPVWGTGTYTEDSSICAAALHSGALSPKGGVVVVRGFQGCSSYLGSSKNGVASANYGAWPASFYFPNVSASGACPGTPGADASSTDDSSPGVAPCPSNFVGWKEDDKSLACLCPAAAPLGSVWGGGIYTEDSSLCAAAIHAGKIKRASGGMISVRSAPGCPKYVGSTRNEVTSSSYGPWKRSFVFSGSGATCP